MRFGVLVVVAGGCAATAPPTLEPAEILPQDIRLVAHRIDTPELPIATLVEKSDCRSYTGSLRGNDPSVDAALDLCRSGDSLTGTLEWRSARSGNNIRMVAGTVDGNTIRLHDVRLIEAAPNPRWRFCTIDDYRLTVEEDGTLSGHYVSGACRDRAQVELRPVPIR